MSTPARCIASGWRRRVSHALMGTWSVTLYGNDAAADIRGDVKELLRAPLDETAIVASSAGASARGVRRQYR
jgi:hypothetical protein